MILLHGYYSRAILFCNEGKDSLLHPPLGQRRYYEWIGTYYTKPERYGWQAMYTWHEGHRGMIVGQIAADRSFDELLADYPYLEQEDIDMRCVMPHGVPRNER